MKSDWDCRAPLGTLLPYLISDAWKRPDCTAILGYSFDLECAYSANCAKVPSCFDCGLSQDRLKSVDCLSSLPVLYYVLWLCSLFRCLMLSSDSITLRKMAIHSLPSFLSVGGLNRLQVRLCCAMASSEGGQTLQTRLSSTVSDYFEFKMGDFQASMASLSSSCCLLLRNLMFSSDFRTHSDRSRWSLCLHLSSSSFKFCPRSLLCFLPCLLVIVQRCQIQTC